MKTFRTKEQEAKRQQKIKVNQGLLKYPTETELTNFFAKQEERFYNFIKRFGVPEEDIEDIITEVMIKVVKDYSPYFNCTLQSFSIGVCRQKITEYYRHKSRNGRNLIVTGLDLSFLEVNQKEFDNIILKEVLKEAKKHFSTREKEVFEELKKELGTTEISKNLKMSVLTVNKLIIGIRAKINIQLDEELGEIKC